MEESAEQLEVDLSEIFLDETIYPNYIKDNSIDIDLAVSSFPLETILNDIHNFRILTIQNSQILCRYCVKCGKHKPLGLFGFKIPKLPPSRYDFFENVFKKYRNMTFLYLKKKYSIYMLSCIFDLYNSCCCDCQGPPADFLSPLPKDFKDIKPLVRIIDRF